MSFLAQLSPHIAALRHLTLPGAFRLEPFFRATMTYQESLETAGVPTGPIDLALDLLNDPYHERTFNHTAAEATLACLRGHGLFPRDGEDFPAFHQRLEDLRARNREISLASSLPMPLSRLFLPRKKLLEIWHSPATAWEVIPSYKVLYPLADLGLERGAEVWRAWDQVEQRDVAVKIFRTFHEIEGIPLGGFFNELRFQFDPASEEILQARAAGRTRRGDPYIVYDRMEGGMLRSHMENRTPQEIAYPASLPLVRRVVGPVARIHREGIIHRDLKPENFLTDAANEQLKLADFGLAIRAVEAGLFAAAVGTAQYRPPEVSKEGAVDDFRRDVFSLGLVLFQAVTGLPVYRVRSLHRSTPPSAVAPSAFVPDWLDRLILRMIAPDPADRPISAIEVMEEIRIERRIEV